MLFGRSAAPERTDGPLTRCSTRLYREPTTFKVRLCVVLGGLTCVNVIGHPLQSAQSPQEWLGGVVAITDGRNGRGARSPVVRQSPTMDPRLSPRADVMASTPGEHKHGAAAVP